MAVANTLAYYVTATIMAVKSLIVQALALSFVMLSAGFFIAVLSVVMLNI